MSRDQRASLLANDDLGSAEYANLGGAGAERDNGPSGTLSTWWRDPRKRLYIIGASITVLIFIIAIAVFAVMSREKNEEPAVEPSSSSSSSGGGAPASTGVPDSTGMPDSTAMPYSSVPAYGSSSSEAPWPPYNPETPWLFPRLSNSTFPSHYDLLEVVDLTTFTFRGNVNITVNIVRPVDHIVLHATGLSCSGVTIMLDDSSVLTPVAWYYAPNQYLVLNFTSTMAAQRNAVIHIEFSSPMFGIPIGLYATQYPDESGAAKLMAATHFDPSSARRAFPCFDEPAMKASFAIVVQHQQDWPSAISNMPGVTLPMDGGWWQTSFETTPPMSTYAVAFVVSNYSYTTYSASCSSNKPAILTRVWAPRHLLQYTTMAGQLASTTIQFYCEYFGIDYPLPKQDHIVVRPTTHPTTHTLPIVYYRRVSYGGSVLIVCV